MLKNIGKRTFSEVMGNPTEISKQPKMQQDMLSEGVTLKYDFMLSLQKIVMAKIISNLWMNTLNQEGKNGFVSWKGTEDTIISKISQLSLPRCISQQLQGNVATFGKSIRNWIYYFVEHVFCTEESECSAFDLISNITWTIRGRIDYGQTAKNILANHDSHLSDYHKYRLACSNCLENEIALLIPKITVHELYLYSTPIEEQPMVYFWTAYLTGDNTQLNNPHYYNDSNQRNRNMSIYEYLMLLLADDGNTFNDIPIRFMWNKLNEEEKAKCITPLVKNVGNIDLIFFLLSNIQYDQQQKILKECSYSILCGILEDWWWWGEHFFPTVLHVSDIMDPISYWRVLNYIINYAEFS